MKTRTIEPEPAISVEYVINELRHRGNSRAAAGMSRFGIHTGAALGFATRKAYEWSERKEEYVKRAGFVLMAEMAVHDKNASDKTFLDFLPTIVREASDERNFVKKAVNWALRQIGKRNANLNTAAIKTCAKIEDAGSRAGKWIAAGALRELTSAPVKKRLASKKSTRPKR